MAVFSRTISDPFLGKKSVKVVVDVGSSVSEYSLFKIISNQSPGVSSISHCGDRISYCCKKSANAASTSAEGWKSAMLTAAAGWMATTAKSAWNN